MIITAIKKRQDINKSAVENATLGLENHAQALYEFITASASIGGEYVEMEFLHMSGRHLVMRIDARRFMTEVEYQFRLAGFDNDGNLFPLVNTANYDEFIYVVAGR